jgi:fatty-acyl-CoA synthase
MMDYPLTLQGLLDRSRRLFSKKEIVTRTEHGLHRYTYRDFYERTHRLAAALSALGVKKGDRVATFAWNHYRHLEAYFAIPCMGAVLHTVNIRLFSDQIAYIFNHAEDVAVLVDDDLLPLVAPLLGQWPALKHVIVMTDQETLPAVPFPSVHSYETLIAGADPSYAFPKDLSEWDPAGMCYTSATTGNPKGVVYSHRGLVLHSMALGLVDTMGLCEADTTLTIVPMFHANAWGVPFAAVWFGAKQVFPGARPDPKTLLELIEQEKVTLASAVPTIWLSALQVLEDHLIDISSLRAIICGGSAAPRSVIEIFQKQYGIPLIHAYGMTETSPLAVVSRLKSYQQDLPEEKKYEFRSKQGIAVPGVEMRIVGEDGREVKADGQEMGEILLRGPWVAKEYYRDARTKEAFRDGWLHTGDVATIDEEGFIRIVDRTKDLVKSGGEWISTVELENALMSHPAVAEAAVIGVPHEKWTERPLACVVLKPGRSASKEELLGFLSDRFAKWWIPDDVVFLDEIPKTSVGKFSKKELRARFSQMPAN